MIYKESRRWSLTFRIRSTAAIHDWTETWWAMVLNWHTTRWSRQIIGTRVWQWCWQWIRQYPPICFRLHSTTLRYHV